MSVYLYFHLPFFDPLDANDGVGILELDVVALDVAIVEDAPREKH